MTPWKISQVGKKPHLKDPILIEGLPGIGNVGKVAVDFIIDEINATKIFEITSHTFPHSVFVNENNLVELPKIEIYYKRSKNGKPDLLLLAGDVQPIDESSCYEFSEQILKLADEFKTKEIITLGGIGLHNVPKKPKVYCTGNNKQKMKEFTKGTHVIDKLYGVVGPIIGVSGLLVGLADKKSVKATALLAETFGHPMYFGVKGAREILKILNSKLELKINLKDLDKEIDEIEKEVIKRSDDLSKVSKSVALKKLKGKLGEEVSYIG